VDAITSLKADHKSVEKLFRQFEKAGDRATKTKADLVKKIIEELSVHKWVSSELVGMDPEAERFDPTAGRR